MRRARRFSEPGHGGVQEHVVRFSPCLIRKHWIDSLRTCSADAIPYPSKLTLLFHSFWYLIPMPILKFVQYTPTKDHIRFRRTMKVINKFAKDLIDEKTEAVLAGKGDNKKDIMSILGA